MTRKVEQSKYVAFFTHIKKTTQNNFPVHKITIECLKFNQIFFARNIQNCNARRRAMTFQSSKINSAQVKKDKKLLHTYPVFPED